MHTYRALWAQNNIIVSAFHPLSSPALLCQEQFDLAAAADVDVMEYCGSMRVTDPDSMKLALQYAANAGILCNVFDDRVEQRAIDMDRAALFAIFDEYKGLPGLGGYYLKDEDMEPNRYAQLINAVSAYDPDSTPFVNQLPDMWGDGFYADRLADIAQLVINKDCFILSMDSYAFPLEPGSVNEDMLFSHFEQLRRAGIEAGVRTGFYAQAIGYATFNYRKPDGDVLRYHVNAALAYGCTEINYFSWGTPNDQDCPGFTDGVIDRAGHPTALYTVAAAINRYAHAVGKTLVGLQAREVYHAGERSSDPVYKRLPTDFFVHTDAYVIVSRLQDAATGRSYLMVVNKDFAAAQTVTLHLDGVDSLQEICHQTGEVLPVTDFADGTLTRTLAPGDALLLALPAGVSYGTPDAAAPADGELLQGARVVASDSPGREGWFVSRVHDGDTVSNARSMGWHAERTQGDEWLLFDLGESKNFSRLELYPAGLEETVGAHFPCAVTVAVSDDGKQFDTVLSAELAVGATVLDLAQTSGRYVRLTFAKRDGAVELAAVRLYA